MLEQFQHRLRQRLPRQGLHGILEIDRLDLILGLQLGLFLADIGLDQGDSLADLHHDIDRLRQPYNR